MEGQVLVKDEPSCLGLLFGWIFFSIIAAMLLVGVVGGWAYVEEHWSRFRPESAEDYFQWIFASGVVGFFLLGFSGAFDDKGKD